MGNLQTLESERRYKDFGRGELVTADEYGVSYFVSLKCSGISDDANPANKLKHIELSTLKGLIA